MNSVHDQLHILYKIDFDRQRVSRAHAARKDILDAIIAENDLPSVGHTMSDMSHLTFMYLEAATPFRLISSAYHACQAQLLSAKELFSMLRGFARPQLPQAVCVTQMSLRLPRSITPGTWMQPIAWFVSSSSLRPTTRFTPSPCLSVGVPLPPLCNALPPRRKMKTFRTSRRWNAKSASALPSMSVMSLRMVKPLSETFPSTALHQQQCSHQEHVTKIIAPRS